MQLKGTYNDYIYNTYHCTFLLVVFVGDLLEMRWLWGCIIDKVRISSRNRVHRNN